MTAPEPTCDDPRVQVIAGVTGESPEEILAEAREIAVSCKTTVDTVLNENMTTVGFVKELIVALDGA